MKNEHKVGDIVVGTVSGIQPYGAFVNFSENHHGLIHISEISTKFVKSVDSYFRVGESVRVKIIGIDEKNNFWKLSLKQLNERERQFLRKPLKITKPKRTKIEVTEKDFEPLKEKLPIWIKETLKEENKND